MPSDVAADRYVVLEWFGASSGWQSVFEGDDKTEALAEHRAIRDRNYDCVFVDTREGED